MKKLRNIIFWIGIFIVILTCILVKPLANLDEVWNFNMARCIANGLVPYKDISMITTPLTSFITAIFLKIFGTEMFITRILAAILAVINLALIYKIFRKLNIPKQITSVLVLAIMFVLKDYFCLDYNFLVLALALFIVLMELKYYEKNTIKSQILIGILGGLAFCTKQSIGILICFVIVINKLFFIRSKSDLRNCLKQMMFRAIGIICPILIFVIYLLIVGSFKDFMDYCLFGIKTFTNKTPYSYLINSKNIVIQILSICIPIILISSVLMNILTKFLKKENKTFFLLTIYSLPTFAMVYPIAENFHFLIAAVIPFLLLIYIVSLGINLGIKKIKIFSGKYILEFFEIIAAVWIILFTIYVEIVNLDALGELSKYATINNFKYIYASDSIRNSIREIDNYINSSEKNVYILDASAAVYMIPINRYNKNYDMFNIGNFGAGGEESQIESIKSEDARYLILGDDYSRNWQNPEQVRSYIKENLVYIESIGMYDVYENRTSEDSELTGKENEISENSEQTGEQNESSENNELTDGQAESSESDEPISE